MGLFAQIKTEISTFSCSLLLNLENWQPIGCGLILENVFLKEILQFFSLLEYIPSAFLLYIPKINKLGVIFGEMPIVC